MKIWKVSKSFICVALAASLLVTSCDWAHAVHAFRTPFPLEIPNYPRVTLPKVHPAYFTQQAMVARLTSQTRLLMRSKDLGTLYVENEISRNTPPRSLNLPSIDNMDLALTALIVVGLRLSGFLDSSSAISIACGNVLIIAKSARWSLKQVLKLGRQAVDILDHRGRQAGGWATYFADGSSILARVKNPKRGDLGLNMQRIFSWQVLKLQIIKMGQGLSVPFAWVVHGHVRFATASRSKRKETHPFQWLKGRTRRVWATAGKTVGIAQSSQRVINTISHNGDFDDLIAQWKFLNAAEREEIENSALIRIHGKMMSQREVGQWLNRVFHTKSNLKGDSPKISGMIDLLHAQGQWDAAARMAWVLGAHNSTDVSPLTEKQVRDLGVVLDGVFGSLAGRIVPTGCERLSEATPEARKLLEQAIIHRLENDPAWQSMMAGRTADFAQLAVKAFLDYDLYTAVHEFMKRAVGSFGLVVTSSLAPGRAIVVSRKQSMAIGYSSDGNLIGASSDPAALKLQPFDYRVDLDMMGETAEIGIDEEGYFINVYPELPVTDPAQMDAPVVQLSEEVLQKNRRVPLRNNPLVDTLPPPTKNSVKQDILDIPAVGAQIRNTWDRTKTHEKNDPAGFNLQSAEDFSRFMIAMALRKAIYRHVALHNHSTQLRDWLTPQIDKLAERARSGELSPKGLGIAMRRLRTRALQWVEDHHKDLEDTTEEGRPIDLLVIGFENSLWVGHQWVDDLNKLMGNGRMVHMRPGSANKILRAMKKQQKNPHFQYKIPAGVIDRNTVIVVASQSGQTFPSINSALQITDKLGLRTAEGVLDSSRVFALTGELDTALGRIVGQQYTENASFSRRIITNGAGRRTSEPSSVAAMAAYQTLTELLMYTAEDLRRVFPDGEGFDPLGLQITSEQILEMKRLRNQFVDRDLPQIVGVDATGNPVQSQVYTKIEQKSSRWAFHVWDMWVGLGALIAHVFLTVVFHMPTAAVWVGLFVRWASHVWDVWIGLLSSVTHLTLTEIVHLPAAPVWLNLSGHFGDVITALAYLFTIPMAVWIFRALTGRPVFVRVGGRTVFVADIPPVYQPLLMFFSKLFSLSFKGLGLRWEGGNPRDHFTPRFAHQAVRGDLGWLGLPDKRLPDMVDERSDSTMSLNQFYGNISMGNSVETLSLGRDGYVVPRTWLQWFFRNSSEWLLTLLSKIFKVNLDPEGLFEDHLEIPTHGEISPIQRQSSLLQSLTETRFDGLARMVTGFVFGYHLVHKVTLGGRLWNYSRSQGGARVFSTASPVSGAKSILWEPLERRGWISKKTADRLAFLEEFVYAGLWLALPLALMPDSTAVLLRPTLWLFSSLLFGLAMHRNNLLLNTLLGMTFHFGVLVPQSSAGTILLSALILHFIWNNLIVPLTMGTNWEEAALSPAPVGAPVSTGMMASSMGGSDPKGPRIRSRPIRRPGVVVPESESKAPAPARKTSKKTVKGSDKSKESADSGKLRSTYVRRPGVVSAGEVSTAPPAVPVPTVAGPAAVTPTTPVAPQRTRGKWWASLAGIALTLGVGGAVIQRSHPYQGVPSPVEVARPAPVVSAPARPLRASPSKVEDIREFIKELRTLHPELAQVLQGDLDPVEEDSLVYRVWMILGPQTKSDDPEKLSPSDKYDLSKIYELKPPQARKSSSRSGAVRGISGAAIFFMATGWAVRAMAAPVQAATQVGRVIVSHVPYYHQVTSGDTLLGLERLYGPSVSTIQNSNLDKIFDVDKIYIGQYLRIPGLEKPVFTMALPDPGWIPSPVSGVWDNLLQSVLHPAPELVWLITGSVLLGMTIWFFRRYARQALVAFLAGLILTLPTAGLFAKGKPASSTPPRPYSYTRTLDTLRSLPSQKPLQQSVRAVSIETPEEVAAQEPVTQTAAAAPLVIAEPAIESEDGVTVEDSASIREDVLKVQGQIFDDPARGEAPLLEAIQRYRTALGAEKLYRKDFYEKVTGQKKPSEKRSRWSWLDPRRSLGLLNEELGSGGFYAEKEAKTLQAYELLRAEEDYLAARNNDAAREAAYLAAVAWEHSERKSRDAAVLLSEEAAADAEGRWQASEAAVMETWGAWQEARDFVSPFEQLLDNPLKKEDSDLKTFQSRLQAARRLLSVSASSLESRFKVQETELVKVTYGAIPPSLARDVSARFQSAIEKPRVAALLGEKSYWELEKNRVTRLIMDAPPTTEAHQRAGEVLVLELAAAHDAAGFLASQTAADAHLDVRDISAHIPTKPVVVFHLDRPAAELARAPVESQPKNPALGDPDLLSKKVDARIEAHTAAAEAFALAASRMQEAGFQVTQDVADRSILLPAFQTLRSAVGQLTHAEGAAGAASNALRLTLGRDPERLVDERIPQDYGLSAITLSVPGTSLPVLLLNDDAYQTQQFRQLARELTGTTEVAAVLQSYFESNHLSPVDPRVLQLAAAVGIDQRTNSPDEKADALLNNLRLAALVIQADAHLRGEPAPSDADALATGLRTHSDQRTTFSAALSGVKKLKTPEGQTALEFTSQQLREAIIFPIPTARARTTLAQFLERKPAPARPTTMSRAVPPRTASRAVPRSSSRATPRTSDQPKPPTDLSKLPRFGQKPAAPPSSDLSKLPRFQKKQAGSPNSDLSSLPRFQKQSNIGLGYLFFIVAGWWRNWLRRRNSPRMMMNLMRAA